MDLEALVRRLVPGAHYEWSSEMILRSIKLVAHNEEYERLPKQFFEKVEKIDGVITVCQLTKLVENTKVFRNTKQLMADMSSLRHNIAFPEIIGLDGTINAMVATAAIPSTSIFNSNRSWLYVFAIQLYEYHQAENQKIPKVAKYVAIFEADKLAKQITNNLCINFNEAQRDKTMKSMYPIAVDRAGKEVHRVLPRTSEEMEKHLFDDRDYYMIPEYRHYLKEELKNVNLSMSQTLELMKFKKVCKMFFEDLSGAKPFNVDPKCIKEIDYFVRVPSHSSLFQNVMFLKSVGYYLWNEVDPNNTQNFSIDMPIPYVQQNPRELITEDKYMSFITKRTTSNVAQFTPTVIDNIPLENKVILPILSTNFELCIPTNLAFHTWIKLFTDDYDSLDMINDNKLDEVRSYIHKCIDEFEPLMETRSTIDYDKYMRMIEEWKEVKKKLTKNREKVTAIPKICAMTSTTFQSWREAMKKRFSGKLFPDYPNILNNADETFIMTTPITQVGKWLAFLAAFPKAAKFIHKQKACRLIAEKEQTGCCALDMVFDGSVKKCDRCDIPLTNVLANSILKSHGEEILERKLNTTKLPGMKRGFLNKPSTKPNAPNEKKEEIVKPMLKEMKRGFLNKKTEERPTQSSNKPSASKSKKVEWQSQLPLPEPLYSLLDETNIPYQLLVNCLKLLVFGKTYDDIVTRIPELNALTKTFHVDALDEIVRKMLGKYENNYLFDQLIKDIKGIIGTYSIPLITNGGFKPLNFHARRNFEIFYGPKQNFLSCAHFIVNYLYKFECIDSKIVLQNLFHEVAASMKFWEMMDEQVIKLETRIREILASTQFLTQLDGCIRRRLEGLENEEQMFQLMISETNLDHQLVETQIKCSFEAALDKFDYARRFIKDATILKHIISRLMQMEYFQSYRTLEMKPDPILSVFRVSGDKCSSLRKGELRNYFVFCQEIDLNITMTVKNDSTKNWAEMFHKDTLIFFHYVTYPEAVFAISHHTQTTYFKSHLVDVPEIGLYTCPPIISPINTLCKPTYIVIRDLFNFLFYEMCVFQCIYDQHIPLINKFVNEFIEKFVRTNTGFYCISYTEVEKFFDYGRSFFAGLSDENWNSNNQFVLNDLLRRAPPPSAIENLLKNRVKPGILKYYEQTIDEVAQSNFTCVPLYPNNDFTFVAFMKEYEPLCRLTHSQDACATVGRCALRLIHDSNFVDSDFCDSANKTQEGTAKFKKTGVEAKKPDVEPVKEAERAPVTIEQTKIETCEPDVEKNSSSLEKPSANFETWPKFFGSYYLTALRMIMFKSSYDNLPVELISQLEDPTTLFSKNEFESLIGKFEQYFTPILEKTYCRSFENMFNVIDGVILESSNLRHLSKSITPLCQYKPEDIRNMSDSIPEFPSFLYHLLADKIDYKVPCSKRLFSFELEKLAFITKNHNLLDYDIWDRSDEYEKILEECKLAYLNNVRLISSTFWKNKKKDESVETMIGRMVDFVFEKYEHPYKQSMVDELRQFVMNADNHREAINSILNDSGFLKFFVKWVSKKRLVLPAASYLDVPVSELPDPHYLVHRIKKPEYEAKFSSVIDAIIFNDDVELLRMILLKKEGKYNKKNHKTQNNNARINQITFSYVTYGEAEYDIRESTGQYVEEVVTEIEMYGHRTCTPLMSPLNTPCKPAHVIVRELFTFLNLELNIFRSIREEHFDNVRLFINQFISQFDLLRDERLCISCDEFEAFLENGRQYFSTMMDDKIVPLYIPNEECNDEEAFEIMKKNIKLELFDADDMYPVQLHFMRNELMMNENGETTRAKQTTEYVYQCFIKGYAGLAYVMHTQKQCEKEWNYCTLKFINQVGLAECVLGQSSLLGFLEKEYLNVIVKSIMPKLPKKMKTSIFAKKNVKVEASSRNSIEADAPAPIVVTPCHVETPTVSSSANSREQSMQPEVTQISRKRVMPVAKPATVLYNSNIIKICLKMILDDECYQKVTRKNRKLSDENNKWMEWQEVTEVMKVVENLIPNFDTVMEVVKDLREIPGSAMLFKSGKCLDFYIPITSNIWNDIREISYIKQKLIRSLSIMENFYEKKNDEVSRILVEYQLDKLAANIGATEIVTIKCPKYFINKWMIRMRKEINMERCEKGKKFVEEAVNKIDTNEDMISQLMEIVMEYTDKGIADRVEKIVEKEYESCKYKITYVIQFLFKIHRSMRIVEALCDSDTANITKRYDKENMVHIPKVRAERNGKIVFVEELQFGLDVAKRLETDKMISDIDLPMDDNSGGNIIETFNYIQRSDLDTIGLPVAFVNMDDFKLKMEVTTPIPSPRYTMCIEAAKILMKLLNIMIELRVFESLDAKNIATLTIFIDNLMMYFKPEINSTFCLDYGKAAELLDETRKKFENMRPRHSNKKDMIEAATDKRIFSSFGAMLSSIMSGKKSKKETGELIHQADIQALLYEYPELGIAYHNQKLCCQDGKFAYCPLDYFEADDKELDYDIPDKCGCTSPEAIDIFSKSEVTRLVKCDVPNSKNKLRLMNAGLKKNIDKLLPVAEPKCLSTSTQTDMVLALDDTIQKELKRLDLLENDVRRKNLDIFDLKKKNTELEQETISAKRQLNALQVASEKKHSILAKENGQWRKVIDDNQRMYERNLKDAEDKTKEQKKLAEDWKAKYQQVVDSNQPSTSTSQDMRPKEVRSNMPCTSSERNTRLENTVGSYLSHLEEAWNSMDAAKQKLTNFLNISSVESDKERAEIEFQNFEMHMQFSIKKAQRNLAILEKDANTDSSLLLKIDTSPNPFSPLTNSKMNVAEEARQREENPECGICLAVLKNGEELFHCPIKVRGKLCNYTMHQECFEKWTKTNSTCPQCGRVVVDPKQYPLP